MTALNVWPIVSTNDLPDESLTDFELFGKLTLGEGTLGIKRSDGLHLNGAQLGCPIPFPSCSRLRVRVGSIAPTCRMIPVGRDRRTNRLPAFGDLVSHIALVIAFTKMVEPNARRIVADEMPDHYRPCSGTQKPRNAMGSQCQGSESARMEQAVSVRAAVAGPQPAGVTLMDATPELAYLRRRKITVHAEPPFGVPCPRMLDTSRGLQMLNFIRS